MTIMHPPVPSHPALAVTGDETAAWRLVITGESEPLLLARILQKLTVPEIELHSAHYEAGEARVGLTFTARPVRARLAKVRLEKIIGVRTVTLGPFG